MATDNSSVANSSQTTEPVKKKTFWSKVGTFMMMGGFMLVLIVIVAIVIAISMIFK